MTTISTKRAGRLPKLLLHKPSGRARIRVAGKDIYLGEYGTVEAQLAYAEEIKKLVAGTPAKATSKPTAAEAGMLVSELAVAFMAYAKKHYRKDGELTSEWHNFRSAVRPLKKLFGATFVDDFGPLSLMTVQTWMVGQEWVRNSINRAISRVRHVFRWGVSREIVKVETLIALQTVMPLQAGRTDASDNPEREAVPDASIEAVKADVSPQVADLIELQRLVGCRSGELLCLTSHMIDRTGGEWVADLKKHKTQHKGKRRFLVFGPKAQAILLKYLQANPTQKLFKMRRTAYCRAITRSCERLEIDRWVPHQLRHTLGSRVREEFSLDHSQAVLGHAKRKQTEDYSKLSLSRAIEVARKIG